MSREDSFDSFENLYKRYYASVVAFFVRFGFSREQARELGQETFVRVYQSMATYRGDSEWAFLQTTARRVALNEIRKTKTKSRDNSVVLISLENSPEVSLLGDPLGARPAEDLLLERSLQKQQRAHLQKAINELPDSLRQCLLLRLSGMRYTQIQKILDISMDAVKSRLNEARTRLREKLTGHWDADLPPEAP